MKSMKKLLALLMVMLMVAAMSLTALAAAGNQVVTAGETAEVVFTYDPAYNLSGRITYDDPSGVAESVEIVIPEIEGCLGSVNNGNIVWVIPEGEPKATKIEVKVLVTIKEDAAEDSVVTVTLKGEYGDATKGEGDDTPIEETATVTVLAKEIPETGDNSMSMMWICAMAVCAAAIVLVIKRRNA